jgi:tRNA A37 threonylcarbamoyladenosine dehydratase
MLRCNRLKGSCVLVVGMRGLGAEVCKDVVLAGIKSLTIIDTTPNDDITSCNRFLCTNGGSTVSDQQSMIVMDRYI